MSVGYEFSNFCLKIYFIFILVGITENYTLLFALCSLSVFHCLSVEKSTVNWNSSHLKVIFLWLLRYFPCLTFGHFYYDMVSWKLCSSSSLPPYFSPFFLSFVTLEMIGYLKFVTQSSVLESWYSSFLVNITFIPFFLHFFVRI